MDNAIRRKRLGLIEGRKEGRKDGWMDGWIKIMSVFMGITHESRETPRPLRPSFH